MVSIYVFLKRNSLNTLVFFMIYQGILPPHVSVCEREYFCLVYKTVFPSRKEIVIYSVSVMRFFSHTYTHAHTGTYTYIKVGCKQQGEYSADPSSLWSNTSYW